MAIYRIAEAARLIGVQPYQIAYAHTTGKILEPKRIFGQRAYEWADIKILADHFGVDLDTSATALEINREEH